MESFLYHRAEPVQDLPASRWQILQGYRSARGQQHPSTTPFSVPSTDVATFQETFLSKYVGLEYSRLSKASIRRATATT